MTHKKTPPKKKSATKRRDRPNYGNVRTLWVGRSGAAKKEEGQKSCKTLIQAA